MIPAASNTIPVIHVYALDLFPNQWYFRMMGLWNCPLSDVGFNLLRKTMSSVNRMIDPFESRTGLTIFMVVVGESAAICRLNMTARHEEDDRDHLVHPTIGQDD